MWATPPNTPSIWAMGLRKGYPWGQGRISVSVRVTRGNSRSRRAGGVKPKSFIRKMPVVVRWGGKGTASYTG